jgi:NADH-quinone oxidoreductase subunit E
MSPELETILHQYPRHQRDKLLPILDAVQEKYGYISEESLAAIGQYLNLPNSKIYGVATFYDHYRFVARGRFHLRLCYGTSCHLTEHGKILDTIYKSLQIRPGGLSRDGAFSLELAPCMGACGLGPVLAVNEDFHTGMTPESFLRLAESLKTFSL